MLATLVRYLLLWVSRIAGAFVRLLRNKVVLNLVLIAAIAAVLWGAERIWVGRVAQGGVGEATAATSGSWLTVWTVLSIWAFGVLFWWVLRARRQLVVDRFDDFTGGEANTYAQSLGVLLAQELVELSDLFNEFDLGRNIQATPEPLTPLNATFQVESIGQFLSEAVSAEASFSLGPFKVPVGILAGIVGRMVQGPRITGQIHRQGGQQVVTAQLVGSLGSRAWRLVQPQSEEATAPPITESAHDLACHVFGDLAVGASVRPRALALFVRSLKAYRSSLHSARGQRLRLQEAERALLESVAEEADFDLAYYNLGVVYTELSRLDAGASRLDAAGKAFATAVGLNNRRWSAVYALARNYYDRALRGAPPRVAIQHLLRAVDHCDRAIRLAAEPLAKAQAVNLKTLSQFQLAQYRIDQFLPASVSARRAVRWAWLALCRAEVTAAGKSVRERTQGIASTCLFNFASILRQGAGLIRAEQDRRAALSQAPPSRTKVWLEDWIRGVAFRKATWSLRQARTLTPWIASVHLTLGLLYLESGRPRRAARSLRVAARVNPASLDALGYLALACAQCDDESGALMAYSRVLDDASTVEAASWGALAQAMDRLVQRLDDVDAFVRAARERTKAGAGFSYYLWFLRRYIRISYRLSGRQLRIPTAAGQVLALGLRDPEALKAQLEPVREQLRSFGQRANSLREVQEQAGKHVKEGQAGIEPLEAMLAEKKDAGLDWEVGEIAHQLGRLFMRLERYQEAEKMFRDAIEQLRTSHASEIQRRGLHALLARALRGQGRTSSALEEASRGVETDPVGTFERTELGWVYYDLAEYDLARNAWRDALYLDPNNAALHHALGLCLLVQLDDTKDKVQRAERLSAATQLLRDALELSDRNDSSRHDTRFLLARAYGHAGRYVEQIQELRTLERAEYYPLFLQVQLADAYLGKRDLKETERRSRRAVADVLAKLAEAGAGANDAIDAPGGEQITLGTALVFARLGIAASLSEREIRLDPALVEVAQAREAVAQIEDPDLREYWGGRCDLFEGEILFRQQRIDEAIAALESALAAGPDAPIYYRLAKSLAVKLERGVPDADATPLAQRALRYCVEASRLDWVGELDDKLLALTAELEAVAKSGAAGQ